MKFTHAGRRFNVSYADFMDFTHLVNLFSEDAEVIRCGKELPDNLSDFLNFFFTYGVRAVKGDPRSLLRICEEAQEDGKQFRAYALIRETDESCAGAFSFICPGEKGAESLAASAPALIKAAVLWSMEAAMIGYNLCGSYPKPVSTAFCRFNGAPLRRLVIGGGECAALEPWLLAAGFCPVTASGKPKTGVNSLYELDLLQRTQVPVLAPSGMAEAAVAHCTPPKRLKPALEPRKRVKRAIAAEFDDYASSQPSSPAGSPAVMKRLAVASPDASGNLTDSGLFFEGKRLCRYTLQPKPAKSVAPLTTHDEEFWQDLEGAKSIFNTDPAPHTQEPASPLPYVLEPGSPVSLSGDILEPGFAVMDEGFDLFAPDNGLFTAYDPFFA